MAICDKLLFKARQSPQNLRFDEACQLAECFGFVLSRQAGSHKQYKRQKIRELINLQSVKGGKAKAYQVRQMLNLIDDYALEEGED